MQRGLGICLLAMSTGCGTGGFADGPAEPDGSARATVAPSAAPPRLAIGPDAETTDVSSLVGRPMPTWDLATWFNTPKPLRPEDLRGRVVLVRWFMSAECPYCSATAPSLVELDADYRAQGLSVVGMYHHKSEGPLRVDDVRELVQGHYHFTFPVAIDEDWKTLKQWWLTAHPESWTSVSFLVDRGGTVRHAHLGGEYAPGSADAKQMRAWIQELLAEPGDGRTAR